MYGHYNIFHKRVVIMRLLLMQFQSIVNTFHRSDLTRCKQMTYDYKYTLFEYKLNSENLMKDYLKLKKKYGHLCVLKTELNHRIEHLSVSLIN